MNKLQVNSIQTTVLACFLAFGLYGCSSSSDSASNDDQTGNESPSLATDSEVSNDDLNSSVTDNDVSVENSDSDTNQNENVQSSDTGDSSENANDVVTPSDNTANDESPEQITTSVDFDISVPQYSSDFLRVQLVWGDASFSANWIGDQFWSVNRVLPTNTEHLLSVTFSDINGDIELARYEESYQTGSNAAETYTITADQFDTQLFDTDEDGVSNLDELLAGTDPLVNDLTALEVRDSVLLGRDTFSFETVARKIPKERPFSLYFEDLPPEPEVGTVFHTTISIELDESGNGAYSESVLKRSSGIRENDALELNATRVNTGESIMLDGVLRLSNGEQDYEKGYRFSNVISRVASDKYSYTGESTTAHNYTSPSWERSTYNLTVKANEDADYCIPIAGTIEHDDIFNRFIYFDESRPAEDRIRRVTTVTKEEEDQYWHVIVVNHDDGSLFDEYLVRTIAIEVLEERGDTTIQNIEWSKLTGEFFCGAADL